MKTEDHHSDVTLNARLEITLVSERFWPFAGLTELNVGELAAELDRQGHAIRIVTAKSEKNWPSVLDYRGIPVNRISKNGAGPWSTYRHARRFSQYFADTDKTDGVLVFGISMVTNAILRAVGNKKPVIIFVNRSSLGTHSVQKIHRRHLEAMRRCHAIVTDCPNLAGGLAELTGLPDVHIIPGGTTCASKPPSLSSQSGARAALSAAHPVLGVDAGQPLAATFLTDNSDAGIFDAIRAWPAVLQHHPKAKLWVVGDGKLGAQVWQQIVELDLIQSVIMPGFFDDDSELLLAADLYIHSFRTSRADSGLIRAMANQRCILATSNDWTVEFVEPDVNGLLAPPENPAALAEAILLAFKKPDLRYRLASGAVKTAELRFSLQQQADRVTKLLRLPAEQPCESTL